MSIIDTYKLEAQKEIERRTRERVEQYKAFFHGVDEEYLYDAIRYSLSEPCYVHGRPSREWAKHAFVLQGGKK